MEELRAPITEDEYRHMPVFQLPPDFTGDKYIRFMNDCWTWLETRCNQPLSLTSQEHKYPVGSRYCNVGPDGILVIAPKHLPIVSVASIKFRPAPFFDWQILPSYEVVDDVINVYGAPAAKGGPGVICLEYSSGYDPVPYDLRLQLALFASHKASAGTFSVTAGSAVLPTWLPKEVYEAIDRYKRVR